MQLKRIHTIAFSLVAMACSETARKEPVETAPGPGPTPTHADAEPAPVADGAVIRVELDAEGRDVEGSATMRVVGAEATPGDEGDAEQVAQAFDKGSAPQVAASEDELDQDSSAQSWHDYRTVSNYARYQPKVYSGKGAQWTYSTPSTSQKGKHRFYYYRSPSCSKNCGQSPHQGKPYPQPGQPGGGDIDAALTAALQKAYVYPLEAGDFLSGSEAQYELGRMLFFDPVLSGNRNTACATCHVPEQGTSNAMSLGPTLKARTEWRKDYATADLLPRNSPALFNRGHKSYYSMFWDSRVAKDESAPGGFKTPAGSMTPDGLNSPLAAQALFPLASRDEMLGCLGQNELADAGAGDNFEGVWSGIVERVVRIKKYEALLAAAYGGVAPSEVKIEHLANAIAIFQSMAWRSDKSPFDRYLAGDRAALDPRQKQGALYFYGKARCSGCHTGALQTDQRHHAIAMPQFGPGVDSGSDYGYGKTTGKESDNYKFRTPSLRNVALTGPWGHDGAYNSLRAIVKHYTNPVGAMKAWNWKQIVLPFTIDRDDVLLRPWQAPEMREAVAAANEFHGVPLLDEEIDALVAFLEALTDPRAADLTGVFPLALPSGYKAPRAWYPRRADGT
jgi:cytochrome c peroxidase